ncbi:MAG: hypothetical protein J5746_00145, partial [Victivallales bacterium]|nr:hypothetical protein [Victivallales bacterium]
AASAPTQVDQPEKQSSISQHELANLCNYPTDENIQVVQLEWAPLWRPHGQPRHLETLQRRLGAHIQNKCKRKMT